MFLLHGGEKPVETRMESHTITLQEQEGKCALPRPLCQESPVISSH